MKSEGIFVESGRHTTTRTVKCASGGIPNITSKELFTLKF